MRPGGYMKTFLSSTMTAVALAALLAGCSSDGGVLGSSLTTSSVDPAKAQAAAPKLDPACIALTAKIDALRKDGVTERAEKVAAGKTQTVSVKRESLAKLTELDRANADYQTKCSMPGLARPMTPAPAAAVVPAAPAAKVASTTAKPAAAKKAVAEPAAAPAVVAVAPAVAPIAVPAAPVAAAPVAVAPAPAPAMAPAPVAPAAAAP